MNKCTICSSSTEELIKYSRSKNKLKLNYCKKCDWIFSNIDKSKSLSEDNLDITRLKQAGLDIPSPDEDFQNGLNQSQDYVDLYIDKEIKEYILEIGSSWGYFLDIVKRNGHHPIGIELNDVRRKYINETLRIDAYKNVDLIEKDKKKFDKIFMFYVLEYINNPKIYIERLYNMLNDKGKLIIITPNKNDVLKVIWCNEGFKKFFYDDHAINYFSINSLKKIAKSLNTKRYTIKSKQGYGLINHLKWFFNNSPSETGIVGGDKFSLEIGNNLEKLNKNNIEKKEISESIKALLNKYDSEYKRLVEGKDYGNQLEFILIKE